MKYALSLVACAVFGFSLHAVMFKPVVTGISVVYVHSKNKATMTDWYRQTLGLTTQWEDDNWTSFEFANGTGFAVDKVEDPNEIQEQKIVINFNVADLKEAMAELKAKGVKFVVIDGEEVMDVTTAYVAHFKDPDGNYVSISQQKKY